MSENATDKKITPLQRKCIEALLTSGNIATAAQEADVHRSTVYRWLTEESFVSALRAAEAEAVAGLSRSLAGLGDKAAQALRDALADHQKITVRLRAAEIVTDRLLKLRELVDFEERLRKLEENNANSSR